jgi:hypothetical protein
MSALSMYHVMALKVTTYTTYYGKYNKKYHSSQSHSFIIKMAVCYKNGLWKPECSSAVFLHYLILEK